MEKKTRFKMYKDGKKWVVAGITALSLVGVAGVATVTTNTVANAETVTTADNNTTPDLGHYIDNGGHFTKDLTAGDDNADAANKAHDAAVTAGNKNPQTTIKTDAQANDATTKSVDETAATNSDIQKSGKDNLNDQGAISADSKNPQNRDVDIAVSQVSDGKLLNDQRNPSATITVPKDLTGKVSVSDITVGRTITLVDSVTGNLVMDKNSKAFQDKLTTDGKSFKAGVNADGSDVLIPVEKITNFDSSSYDKGLYRTVASSNALLAWTPSMLKDGVAGYHIDYLSNGTSNGKVFGGVDLANTNGWSIYAKDADGKDVMVQARDAEGNLLATQTKTTTPDGKEVVVSTPTMVKQLNQTVAGQLFLATTIHNAAISEIDFNTNGGRKDVAGNVVQDDIAAKDSDLNKVAMAKFQKAVSDIVGNNTRLISAGAQTVVEFARVIIGTLGDGYKPSDAYIAAMGNVTKDMVAPLIKMIKQAYGAIANVWPGLIVQAINRAIQSIPDDGINPADAFKTLAKFLPLHLGNQDATNYANSLNSTIASIQALIDNEGLVDQNKTNEASTATGEAGVDAFSLRGLATTTMSKDKDGNDVITVNSPKDMGTVSALLTDKARGLLLATMNGIEQILDAAFGSANPLVRPAFGHIVEGLNGIVTSFNASVLDKTAEQFRRAQGDILGGIINVSGTGNLAGAHYTNVVGLKVTDPDLSSHKAGEFVPETFKVSSTWSDGPFSNTTEGATTLVYQNVDKSKLDPKSDVAKDKNASQYDVNKAEEGPTTNPTDPTNPTNPTDPTNPTNPTNPTTPTTPGNNGNNNGGTTGSNGSNSGKGGDETITSAGHKGTTGTATQSVKLAASKNSVNLPSDAKKAATKSNELPQTGESNTAGVTLLGLLSIVFGWAVAGLSLKKQH